MLVSPKFLYTYTVHTLYQDTKHFTMMAEHFLMTISHAKIMVKLSG